MINIKRKELANAFLWCCWAHQVSPDKTLAELEQLQREAFEAGGAYHVELNDSNGGWKMKNPDFDDYLSSKSKEGEI